MPRNDLSNMQYDEVSLVDFPANRAARTVLAKRGRVTKNGPITQDDLGYEGDDQDNPSDRNETPRDKMLNKVDVNDKGDTDDDSDGGTNVTGGTTGPSTKPTQTPTNKRRGGPIDATHMGLEVDDDSDDGEDGVDAKPRNNSERSPNETGHLSGAVRYSKGARSPMPRQSADTDDLPQVVTKGDLDAIVKSYNERLEKAEARAAAAEELAKAEADKVAHREAVAKANTWTHIPQLEPTSFGETWLEISKAAPEAIEVLEKIFDATEAALATPSAGSSIYRASGRGNTGTSTTVAKGGDPMAPIMAEASAIRKSDPSLSMQQAIVKVMQGRPELATAYRESMGFVPEGGYSE